MRRIATDMGAGEPEHVAQEWTSSNRGSIESAVRVALTPHGPGTLPLISPPRSGRPMGH